MNPNPTNWGQIFNLATKIYAGLLAFAAAIPVTLVTAAQMLTSKTAFKNAGTSYNVARTNLGKAYKASKPSQDALYQWLLTVRALLARRLGEKWSPAWVEAGFVTPTTQVPPTIEARIALGLALVTYYTDNPGYEVPDMEVTAAQATELTEAAVSGQAGVSTAEQALKTADDARQPVKKDLLTLMEDVNTNLRRKLAKDDPRWLAFGLEMPSTQTRPGAPTGLAATIAGSEVILSCDPDARTTRYRWRTRIVGEQEKFQLAASTVDPMAKLEDTVAGTTLEIIVQAVNGRSQSVASDPILVVIPLLAAPEVAAKLTTPDAELAPLAAITPNGNGNGNSNGNGHAKRVVSRS